MSSAPLISAGTAFAIGGALVLFTARRQRDRALQYWNAWRGPRWIGGLSRGMLTSRFYVLQQRIGGGLVLAMGLALVAAGALLS